MTSAGPTPQPWSDRLRRGRSNFRRWRRARPFWGGLLVILAGLEIFYSTQLDLGMEFKIGQEGFLATVIPAALVLAGALLWFSPGQRIFYGILATLISVYSLMGVNLGGFIVGMLLGAIGGSLGAAWSPEPAPAPDPPADETAPRHMIGGPDERLSIMDDRSGPRRMVGGAGYAEEERMPSLGDRFRRRHTRMLGTVLAALTMASVAVAVAHGPAPAWAEPCPSASVQPGRSATPTRPSVPGAKTPAGPSAAQPSPSASSPAPEDDGDHPVADFFKWLFGGGKKAEPTPTPSSTPSTAPAAPTKSAPPGKAPSVKPSADKSASTSASPCPAAPPKVLAVEPGQPRVTADGGTMLADSLTMSGLSFDGVVDLPTVTGTVKVLQFSMAESVATPFDLQVRNGPGKLSLKSSKLTISGDVKFYTKKFSGTLLCLIPVTFTPESPPPLILPELLFCNANITLNYVQATGLTMPSLGIDRLT